MSQVVKTVEAELARTKSAKLSVVRLKVSALSHLLTHDQATLQATFQLASRGTTAEGATLEVIPLPADGWCPQCERDVSVTQMSHTCPACGGLLVAGPAGPEVMLHQLVVHE